MAAAEEIISDEWIADHVGGIVYSNAIVAAAAEFLQATGGLEAEDPIKMPLKAPLLLLRLRIRQAVAQRLADIAT